MHIEELENRMEKLDNAENNFEEKATTFEQLQHAYQRNLSN